MATVTHHNELLSRLVSGDIVSDELYYHKSKIKNCYVEFNNSHQKVKLERALSLNKILCHIIETERSNTGSIFKAKGLEDMYIALLTEHNISYEGHIKHFVERIMLQLPLLEKGAIHKQVYLVFKGTMKAFTFLIVNSIAL